ncbi:MAG: diaminopimelate decarboxylase [Lachnospiraceae bacterium]|nr:diaminopimelate decarboxylase [Lachnospiraceae bacterium]
MESFVNEVNFFEGNNPEDIAAKYGTPVYVYNERILRKRIRNVAGVVKKFPYRANFSMKANSNLTILKIVLEEGLNADAMSIGEVKFLELAGFPADRIFFVPNNVSDEELQYAIDRNITVSLDSISQLERFGRLAPGSRCAVRINPGIGAGHSDSVVTAGKNTKFAVEEKDIPELLETAEKHNLKIVGINQHIGSLFMEPDPYLAAVTNLLRIAHKFDDLEFIDFGGGFGTPYHKLSGEKEFDINLLTEGIEKLLGDFIAETGKQILFKSEPGRYVVADSSVLLGRVYATKENYDKKYAGTDIGQNVLVRPTLYGSWHDVEVLRGGKPVLPSSGTEVVSVTGNICESGDIIAKERELPVIKEGDLVCVLDAGAYGYSMCSPYNSRPRPAEVMICEDGSVKCIRRAETFEDLIRLF